MLSLFRDVKRTSPSRRQPMSGPRFPRGLELALWVAGSLLLTYGIIHIRMGKQSSETAPVTISPTSVSATYQQSPEKKSPNSGWVQVETSEKASLRKTIVNIEAQTDTDKREQLIVLLVNSVASTDIQTMLIELEGMRREHNQHDLVEDVILRLIRRWAQFDSNAASAWVQQLPASAMRQECLAGVAVEWANANLSDAVSWGQQMTNPMDKENVLFGVANEAVHLDPVVALQLAASLPPSERWKDLVQRSAQELATNNGEQAVTWARQIEDESLRNQVLSSMAVAISEKDPISAATLATTEIPAGRMQSDAVIGIIERWAQQQPEQAATWVETFPKSSLKATAVENLVAMWSLSDSQGAERWRDQMKIAE